MMTIFEKRRKLESLKKGLNCDIDYIKELINQKGFLKSQVFQTVDVGRVLYRTRISDPKRLFEKVSEISYPEITKVNIKKGRCNKEGQSIFYASNSELGTILEFTSAGLGLNIMFTIAQANKKSNSSIYELLFKKFGLEGYSATQFSDIKS